MNSIDILSDALEYIESNLTTNIKTQDIANACYCSKSSLERLFRYINFTSIRDYIIRRRMTLAAKLLVTDTEKTLLEVALQYGYGSNEAFTRAFEQIWHCKPSEYRKTPRCYELYPRLICPLENGDGTMRRRKNVDISELYDLFMERNHCYFVCCDIKSLVPINEISHKAGDKAIIESLNRMYDAAGENDVVFRIGGDEFALLTDSEDSQYAQRIVDVIVSKNGNPIEFEGQQIPLHLYVTSVCLQEKTQRYSDLMNQLQDKLDCCKM